MGKKTLPKIHGAPSKQNSQAKKWQHRNRWLRDGITDLTKTLSVTTNREEPRKESEDGTAEGPWPLRFWAEHLCTCPLVLASI